MIHVPDEVAREITEDLRMAYRNGVGGVRTKMNAEFLEDLLEGDRPDLDQLARQHCSAEGIEIHARTEDVALEEYTGEVD